MTDRLTEIEKRLERATQSPWLRDPLEDGHRFAIGAYTPGGYRMVAVTEGANGIADAALIASAPTDIAYLLGEVKRLQQNEILMRDLLDHCSKQYRRFYWEQYRDEPTAEDGLYMRCRKAVEAPETL